MYSWYTSFLSFKPLGRMIDLLCLNSGRLISFTRISFVVLDEADRMLDDGFEPQVCLLSLL